MDPAQPHLIYEFGEFELDALRQVVISRASGQQLPITGRSFEALLYLLERPGQLVDKRTLLEALWPHVVVEEGNLTQTIHMLRRALGEQPGEHRYIVTVPGRGYRFVAEVAVRNKSAAPWEPSAPARRPRRIVWAATALVLALATVTALLLLRDRPAQLHEPSAAVPPSVAVLPFVDMSPQQDQEHFAEGVAEEIINLLARSPALRVIARTSSFSFKDQNADIGTIAQRLAVTHVIEGSVRKSGERVRVTAQLIDGATGMHVWSDTYDRNVQDIFVTQREIAAAVANALHVTLDQDAQPQRAETLSAQAYERYLHGRHLFNRRSGSDLLHAKAHFEQAVKIDPEYARAWAALAGVYIAAFYEKVELPNAMENWREAVQRAVALAPDLAEANVRAAQYYWHTGDSHTGGMYVERAIAADPGDPLVLALSLDQAVMDGRMDEAVGWQQRMVAIDPISKVHRANLGVFLMLAGRLDEARDELERALELTPASVVLKSDIAAILILQRQTDAALRVIEQLPAGAARTRALAIAQFVRGERAEGEAMLAQLLELAKSPDAHWSDALAVAEVYAAKDDADRAFEWIARTRERLWSEGTLLPDRMLRRNVQTAVFLQSLHTDPRWHELLAATDKR